MALDLAVVAGSVSTVVFAGSMLPMVTKAVRTRDLASYSVPSLLLSNAGNVVHSVYVLSLPAGPIWALHTFYLVVTALMLALALRQRRTGVHRLPHPRPDETHDLPDVATGAPFLASEHAGHPGPAGPEDDHDDDHHHPARRPDRAVRV
ncbi:hypothetical protein [Cellulomonas sp. Marseille-Q8402]